MIYGYMRVSTVGQVKGNSLEEQERILYICPVAAEECKEVECLNARKRIG